MRFPNLRYGNPTEFAYYCMGRTNDSIAKTLRRDERTVRDWLSGRSKLPWWVPEIMRLKRMEPADRQRQMFGALGDQKRLTALGVVRGRAPTSPASRKEKAPDHGPEA